MTIVKIGTVHGFTRKEIRTLDQAVEIVNKAINDPKFHTLVLAQKFTSTKDHPATVLAKLLSGADLMDPKEDHEIDVDFVMYYRWWSKVIGFVVDGERTIHTNRKYFGDPVSCASNLVHEYMHLLGYSHYSARDYRSVPYTLGNLIDSYSSL
jgi:hypothetical protein